MPKKLAIFTGADDGDSSAIKIEAASAPAYSSGPNSTLQSSEVTATAGASSSKGSYEGQNKRTTQETSYGIVKWFDPNKGFGFISLLPGTCFLPHILFESPMHLVIFLTYLFYLCRQTCFYP
jgi:hypothetical protein